MLKSRRATVEDLDFLVQVDVNDEGITHPVPCLTAADLAAQREKILPFVAQDTHCAWVWEESDTGELVGTIMCIFRDRQHEARTEANEFLFRFIDPFLISPDGRFCEVFQLWVAPVFRRRGLAESLINEMEAEASKRGMPMVYMHTEERNQHVIHLGLKCGCREIQRGPMWDEVVRVCMVKDLNAPSEQGIGDRDNEDFFRCDESHPTSTGLKAGSCGCCPSGYATHQYTTLRGKCIPPPRIEPEDERDAGSRIRRALNEETNSGGSILDFRLVPTVLVGMRRDRACVLPSGGEGRRGV